MAVGGGERRPGGLWRLARNSGIVRLELRAEPRVSSAMCNLYSMTTTHQAMRQLFRLESGWNQLRLPGIFPDYQAPIVRRGAAGEREIVAARWGMPTPPAHRKGPIDRGVTNIRNVSSPHWRRWLRPEFRCLVPATSFCEPTDLAEPVTGRKVWTCSRST